MHEILFLCVCIFVSDFGRLSLYLPINYHIPNKELVRPFCF